MIAWYLGQLLAFLAGARVASCPDGWSAMAARHDGTFRCLAPVLVGICDSRAGCDDDSPDDEIVGRVWCRVDERAVIDFDGVHVRCVAVRS